MSRQTTEAPRDSMVPSRRVPSGSGAVRTASRARSAALMISPGLLQESLSGGGKIDRTADALKQRNAEFDFQLTDLHGDGRLGIA